MFAGIDPIDARHSIRHRTALPRGSLLRVMDGAGLTVRAGSGRLWITQEKDTRDILLRAGDAFELDRDGLALVYAVDPAEVVLSAPRVREQRELAARFQLVAAGFER
jgi:hypothetical protein